jgi:hypothetical protein
MGNGREARTSRLARTTGRVPQSIKPVNYIKGILAPGI